MYSNPAINQITSAGTHRGQAVARTVAVIDKPDTGLALKPHICGKGEPWLPPCAAWFPPQGAPREDPPARARRGGLEEADRPRPLREASMEAGVVREVAREVAAPHILAWGWAVGSVSLSAAAASAWWRRRRPARGLLLS